MFSIEFQTNNAAFDELNKEAEINRILQHTATQVAHGFVRGNVRDINGNSIGKWELKND